MIAFGGRALRPGDDPKYLNSSESEIYKKKSVLYNLNRAKQAIRQRDRAILVEGYMDVIGVYAAGIHEVVACCGTSFTDDQVRSIKRHSENLIVNFDPDAAGANATEGRIEKLHDILVGKACTCACSSSMPIWIPTSTSKSTAASGMKLALPPPRPIFTGWRTARDRNSTCATSTDACRPGSCSSRPFSAFRTSCNASPW